MLSTTLEQLTQECHQTLTQIVSTFGVSTCKNYWPVEHEGVLPIIRGEVQHPLSIFQESQRVPFALETTFLSTAGGPGAAAQIRRARRSSLVGTGLDSSGMVAADGSWVGGAGADGGGGLRGVLSGVVKFVIGLVVGVVLFVESMVRIGLTALRSFLAFLFVGFEFSLRPMDGMQASVQPPILAGAATAGPQDQVGRDRCSGGRDRVAEEPLTSDTTYPGKKLPNTVSLGPSGSVLASVVPAPSPDAGVHAETEAAQAQASSPSDTHSASASNRGPISAVKEDPAEFEPAIKQNTSSHGASAEVKADHDEYTGDVVQPALAGDQTIVGDDASGFGVFPDEDVDVDLVEDAAPAPRARKPVFFA